MTACWCRLIQPENRQEEEGKRRRQQVHGGSLPQCRAPFNGCEIGHRTPAHWAEIPEAKLPATASTGSVA